MRKRIRRNAHRMITNILRQASEIEYFTSDNDYQGGKIGYEVSENVVSTVIYDIAKQHAIMFENADGTHTLHYAGRCKWEIK